MIDPQNAVNIAAGGMQVRPFMEQVAAAVPPRPMPAIAGMQKQHLQAIADSASPGARSLPQQVPITQPSGVRNALTQYGTAAGAQLGQPALGCKNCGQVMGLSPKTWPTWLKIFVPVAIIGAGALTVWWISKPPRESF